MVLILESLIDGHALLKPSSMADNLEDPLFISSLILSKIKILASTAMPIERINPAIPDKVIVIDDALKIAKVKIVYNKSAIAAKNPKNR